MASLENPYGLTVGAAKHITQPYPNGSLLINTLVQYGFGNLRFQLHWDAMETTQGQRSYVVLDDMVGLANAAGLYFVFVFQKPPDFGNPPGPYMQRVNPHETTPKTCGVSQHSNFIYLMAPTSGTLAFVKELVTRYNGKTTKNPHDSTKFLYIDCYEIGNEEFDAAWNYDCAQPTSLWNGSTGQEGRDPHWFCDVAPQMAIAIRAVNPAAKVGMHGSAWDLAANRQAIIKTVYQVTYQNKRVADYLDYFNFHIYPGIPPDQSSAGQQSLPQEIADYTSEYPSGETKRIQITEIGWDAPSGISLAQAASNYKTAMDLMIASGVVEKFYAFTIALNDAAETKNLVVVNGSSLTPTPAISQIQSYSQDKTIVAKWPKLTTPTGSGSGTGTGTGTGSSSPPILQLSVNLTPPGSVSLTQEGTDTWAHYGTIVSTDYDVKAGSGSTSEQISAPIQTGSGPITQAQNTAISYSWSDGASPHITNTGSTTGVSVVAQNSNGFKITAPADTQERTLKVYVSVSQAGGILEATLSDGSAPAVTDSSLVSTTGTATACYTLIYQAAAASSTITVYFSNNATIVTNKNSSASKQVVEVTKQSGTVTSASKQPNIMMIAMENRAYSDITKTDAGAWPTVNGWMSTYANVVPFYGITHPSLPNYIAFAAGSTLGVNGDGTVGQFGPFSAQCLVDLLDAAGISWRAYAENIPAGGLAGMSKDTASYAARHFPWVYFNGVRTDTAKLANLVNYTSSSFLADLNGASPPQFVWLTPNLMDDAHNSGATSTVPDKFLGALIPQIQQTAWYQNNGVIILWWDESHPDVQNDAGIGDANPGGGQTGCVVISEAVKGTKNFTTPTNHYGVLRSLCLAYGLTPPGDANHTNNGDITKLLQSSGTGTGNQSGGWKGVPPGSGGLSLVDTDTFSGRTSSSSWGTASGGSSWTAEPSPASSGSPTYAVTTVGGTISSSSSSGGVGVQLLGSQTTSDGQGVVGLMVSSSPGDSAEVLLRADSTGKNAYAFGLVAGQLTIRLLQNGSPTTLTSAASGTTSLNANQGYWLRAEVQGSSLSARIWPADGTSAEPTNWQVTTTDTTLQQTGQFGLRGGVAKSADVVTFSQFAVYSIAATAPLGSICVQSATLALSSTQTTGIHDLATRLLLQPSLTITGTSSFDLSQRMNLQLKNTQRKDLLARMNLKPPPPQHTLYLPGRLKVWNTPVSYGAPGDLLTRLPLASQSKPVDLATRLALDALPLGGHDLPMRLLLASLLDTFTRSNQSSSWGTATDGHAWTTSNGSLTEAIAGNVGTLTGSTTLSLLVLGSASSVQQTTPDLLLKFQVTASSDVVGLAGRATGTSSSASYYGALLGNGTLRLVLVSGGGTPSVLASLPLSSLSANTWYWLRFQVSGSKLLARYWQDGQTAPTDWLLTTTDTTLATTGYMGILTQLAASGDKASIGYFAGARVDPLPTPYDILQRMALVLDQDTFSRVARQNGWGLSAESGSIWVLLQGGAPLSTTGSAGAIGTASNTTTSMLMLGFQQEFWCDVRVRLTAPPDATSVTGVLLCCQDQNNTYSVTLVGGKLTITATSAGVQTTLASVSVSLTAGNWYWMHAALVAASLGSTQRIIQVRVWADGQSEPGSPTLVSPADGHVVGEGGVGLIGWTRSSTALLYSQFSVRSQTFASTRDLLTRVSLVDTTQLDISSRITFLSPLPTGLLGEDTFSGRTVFTTALGATFGTADDGQRWTTVSRSKMILQVSGGEGQWVFDQTGGTIGSFQALLGTTLVADATVVARLSLGVPGSSNVYTELYLRYSGGNSVSTTTYYAARISSDTTDNVMFVKCVAGRITIQWVATLPLPGARTPFWLKFNLAGPVISLKAWLDSESEPLGWMWVGVDTDVVLPGQFGVGGMTSGTSVGSESTIDSLVVETIVTESAGIATRMQLSLPHTTGPRYLPLGGAILGQTRYGDGKYTPVLHVLSASLPLTYTISPSRYAAPLALSYINQRPNTAPLLLYYLLSPPSQFAIDDDQQIINPDEVIYSPRPVTGRTLLGGPLLQGYGTITWSYSVLRWAEFEQLIGHYDPNNPRVRITCPNEEGVWGQREVVMMPPTYGTMVPGQTIEGVSFTFTGLLF